MGASVDEFFADTTVLLTGFTGFIGKALVEKLLRSQNNIKKVIALVRSKRGESPTERAMKDIFNQPVFDSLRRNNPNFMDKVHLCQGDIVEPEWGLSEDDKEMLLDQVNIVFNCAASLNMGASLKYNVRNNVESVIELLNLCRQMKNLKSVVLLSTAYSNCNYEVIEEKVYKSSISPELILKMCEECDDWVLQKITPFILNGHPNTYTFSKSIMENVLLNYNDLPVTVFRPAAVTSSYSEPIPGWIDNTNGLAGMLYAINLGVLRTGYLKFDVRLNAIPVDLTVNALICSAWHGIESRSPDSPRVYNCAGDENKKSYKDIFEIMDLSPLKLEKSIWKPTRYNAPCIHLKKLYLIFLHYIPAFLMDVILVLSGNKLRLTRIYAKKIHPQMDALHFFGNSEWTMIEQNTHSMLDSLTGEERRRYDFDFGAVDFKLYVRNICAGMKVFLSKEKIEDNHKAVRWHRILAVIHYTFVAATWCLIFWILSKVISCLW